MTTSGQVDPADRPTNRTAVHRTDGDSVIARTVLPLRSAR
jgi:hypothetical protein